MVMPIMWMKLRWKTQVNIDLSLPMLAVRQSMAHIKFLFGGEIAISSRRQLFTFLSKMQDEVHRFAIGYHHARRSKNTFRSSLTTIDGVGEVRAKALLKYFRTIDNISKADLEELEAAPKMTKDSALAVYRYFHGGDSPQE